MRQEEKEEVGRAGAGAALATVAVALALAIPSNAGAACEVPLPSDPSPDEGACGATNPPPVFGGGGGGGSGGAPGSPPRLVLWTSGYDLNPLNGRNRSGIFIARVDGTQRRKLVSFERVSRDFEPHGLNLPDDHPSFSPDYRKIVFTSNRADKDNWDIYVMNVNGSNPTRLTTHPGLDTEPVFSPSGNKIAFATETFGALEIATMNLNGTGITKLTNTAFESIEPAWRPDGQEIAFARVFPGFPKQKDVFVIAPDGSGERQVTSTDREDHDPTYSPAGTEIVITSERPPTSVPYGNVHKIRVSDGLDLGDLTSDVTLAAGDPFWSQDGQTIAYFKSAGPLLRSPQNLFVMNAGGGGKFKIPGEAAANIHPALGLGVDSDNDGTPNYLESGSVGRAALSPRRVRAGRTRLVRFAWKHPLRWRNLDTMSLRISSGRRLLAIVRFGVRDESFSLFDGRTDKFTNARRLGAGVLRTSAVALDLDRTKVVGVNTKKLSLLLALRFRARVRGDGFRLARRKLRVRVQASSKSGRNQEEEFGRLKILRTASAAGR